MTKCLRCSCRAMCLAQCANIAGFDVRFTNLIGRAETDLMLGRRGISTTAESPYHALTLLIKAASRGRLGTVTSKQAILIYFVLSTR